MYVKIYQTFLEQQPCSLLHYFPPSIPTQHPPFPAHCNWLLHHCRDQTFWGGEGGEEIKGPVKLRVKELLRVGMGVGASAEKVWKSETNTL